MALLATENLTFYYPDETEAALKNMNLSIEPGEFIVLCGPSGSGKSTLLRLLKQEIAPYGILEGEIFYNGKPLTEMEPQVRAKKIGMVFQDPENQMVMDCVFDELIFGLENIGLSTATMRKKLAEMVHFFSISHLLEQKVHYLSGGQKQMVNLVSILLMEPTVLLLDEPTAQLDPVSAKDFLQMVKQMNEEFGITVIIAEHRLEEVFPLADRVIVLEGGAISVEGKPKEVIYELRKNEQMVDYLPSSARLFIQFDYTNDVEKIPLTVKEGKQWINELHIPADQADTDESLLKETEDVLSLKNVHFQYEKTSEKILNGLNLTVHKGNWLAIVGANGTGKSTLLKVMAGLELPQKGTVKYNGKRVKKPNPLQIGYLPQNPKLLFMHDTIRDHFYDMLERLPIENGEPTLQQLVSFFNLEPLLERHPYDISGGEMQKVALATVLLTEPNILLLDEPTKGLDPVMKKQLGEQLKHLQNSGLTIIIVTHDIEFAAVYADDCGMMFQGEITVTSPTNEFFRGNSFYTTVINRITRDSTVPEVLTVEEAKQKWRMPSKV